MISLLDISKMQKTRQDRIKTVFDEGSHVVILGAGASIASATRDPEPNSKQLPSMNNFIEVVGLGDIINDLPQQIRSDNFEELYINVSQDRPDSDEMREIDHRVFNYFKDLRLSENATIYDYLVLALRPRDLIATFNWDPFLHQAIRRNRHVTEMPQTAYLHGRVTSSWDEIKMDGEHTHLLKSNGKSFLSMYPPKNNMSSPSIDVNTEWQKTKGHLGSRSVTRLITVFGFKAPSSDRQAVELFNDALQNIDGIGKEQLEIIDIEEEQTIRSNWSTFVHAHHYECSSTYFGSSLASNPWRTCESHFQHTFPKTVDEALSESNPIPVNFKTLQELWSWHEPLLNAEVEWLDSNSESKRFSDSHKL